MGSILPSTVCFVGVFVIPCLTLSANMSFSADYAFIKHGEAVVKELKFKDSQFIAAVDTTFRVQCTIYSLHLCDWQEKKNLTFNKEVFEVKNEQALNATAVEYRVYVKKDIGRRQQYVSCVCTDFNGQPLLLDYESLLVGYGPSNVTNFSCYSESYRNLICTWDPQHDRNVTWKICYNIRNENGSRELTYRYTNHECIDSDEPKLDARSFRHDVEYNVFITASNGFGALSTPYVVIMDDSLVKLDPPKVTLVEISSVWATIQIDFQCARNNYKLLFVCINRGLKWRAIALLYDADNKEYMKNESFSMNGIFKQVGNKSLINVTMTTLSPFRSYKLLISSKVNDEDLWSDDAALLMNTTSSVPNTGPEVNANGFKIVDDPSCPQGLKATIYWKELEPYKGGNGIVIGYEILPWNLVVHNSLEATICVGNESSKISIYALNDKGRSQIPTEFVLPEAKQVLKHDSCFLTTRALKDNEVQISFPKISEENLINSAVFVFWCQAKDNLCKNQLEWMEIKGSEVNHTLQLETEAFEYKYGVSVGNEDMKSGVVWSQCIFADSVPDPDTDVRLEVIGQTGYALVTITPVCRHGMAEIRQAVINLCEPSYDDHDDCVADTLTSVSIGRLGHCQKHSKVELTSKKVYSIWLSLEYEGSVGYKNTRPIRFLAQNSDKTLLTALIAVIPVGVLMGLLVVIIRCCWCGSDDTNIKVPTAIRPIQLEIETDDASSLSDEKFYFDWSGTPEKNLTETSALPQDYGTDEADEKQGFLDLYPNESAMKINDAGNSIPLGSSVDKLLYQPLQQEATSDSNNSFSLPEITKDVTKGTPDSSLNYSSCNDSCRATSQDKHSLEYFNNAELEKPGTHESSKHRGKRSTEETNLSDGYLQITSIIQGAH